MQLFVGTLFLQRHPAPGTGVVVLRSAPRTLQLVERVDACYQSGGRSDAKVSVLSRGPCTTPGRGQRIAQSHSIATPRLRKATPRLGALDID